MLGCDGGQHRKLAAQRRRTAPHPPRPARAKALLGAGQLARAQGDYGTARELMDTSIGAYQQIGDDTGTAFAMFGAGFVAEMQESYDDARRYFRASMDLARQTGNGYAAALTLHHLGLIALELDGDLAAAREFLQESLANFRTVGFPRHIALVLSTLGIAAGRDGQISEARQLQSQALGLFLDSGQHVDIHRVLQGFAELAEAEGDLEQLVRLAATAERQRSHTGDAVWGLVRRQRDRRLAAARKALGDTRYEAAWREGQGLSPTEAAARLLGPATCDPQP